MGFRVIRLCDKRKNENENLRIIRTVVRRRRIELTSH